LRNKAGAENKPGKLPIKKQQGSGKQRVKKKMGYGIGPQ
jgi:hypothetical protein